MSGTDFSLHHTWCLRKGKHRRIGHFGLTYGHINQDIASAFGVCCDSLARSPSSAGPSARHYAALFSVVNGVLLNPLPFPEPEQQTSLIRANQL